MPRAAFPSGRKSLLICILAAIGIGGAWWWTLPPREPVSRGQRLSEWLDGPVGENVDLPLRTEELHGFGPGAVPWLTYAAEYGPYPIYHPKPLPLDHAPDWLRRRMPESWGGRREPAFHGNPMCVLRALQLLGPEAAPAIPTLVRVLERMGRGMELGSDGEESMFANHASAALYCIGPAAWPTVQQELEHGNPYVRAALLAMMPIRLGSTAKPAPEADAEIVATLIKACSDPQAPARWGAASGLCRCWEKRSDLTILDAAIPHLIRLLSDPDWIVRNNAMYALVPCGAKAAPAIPRLIELLGDHDPQIRASAADALALLDTNEKRSAARLRVLLQDPDRRCSSAAAKALRALGLSPEE